MSQAQRPTPVGVSTEGPYYDLTVERVVRETHDSCSIVLEIAEPLRELFQYRAGQFLTFRVTVGGKRLVRCYSLASSPDADSSHKGSGDATIYELEDGTLVLRLEGIDITNGPDLHVFLAPVADASEREDVMADGYLDLGALKGNRGDQNYIILGNFDPDRDWTVVVYCVPFHVIFSTAPLAAA